MPNGEAQDPPRPVDARFGRSFFGRECASWFVGNEDIGTSAWKPIETGKLLE
jgi:hypothetical protein